MIPASDVFTALKKRWRLGLAIALACIVVGLVLNATSVRKYQATTELFVSTSQSQTIVDLAQGSTFALARVQSYTDAATSPLVTSFVISQLHLGISSAALAAKISAVAPANKVIIDITVSDTDPTRCANIANSVANRFATVVEDIESNGASASPVKLTVLHPALVPSSPYQPNTTLNLTVAAAVGVLLAFVCCVLRESFDRTIKSSEQLEAVAQTPVLGVIPWDRSTAEYPIAFRDDGKSGRAESFRTLRNNAQYVEVDSPPKIFAVTSGLPGEGKTSTAVNFAAALSEAGYRVCLVDADLRRPSVASLLGLVADIGLTSVLSGKSSLEDVLQNAGKGLAVLTAGALPPNPGELLLSQHFADTLATLASLVDYVIIDTAPLLVVSDGGAVARASDVTMVVVRAQRTKRDDLARTLTSLANVGVQPVGAVLNMMRGGGADYSYQAYGYSADRPLPTK